MSKCSVSSTLKRKSSYCTLFRPKYWACAAVPNPASAPSTSPHVIRVFISDPQSKPVGCAHFPWGDLLLVVRGRRPRVPQRACHAPMGHLRAKDGPGGDVAHLGAPFPPHTSRLE